MSQSIEWVKAIINPQSDTEFTTVLMAETFNIQEFELLASRLSQ